METFQKLKDISDSIDSLNLEITKEEKVWAEELAARKRKGLTGDAAITHYNEWMDCHGMGHLLIN